jgi:hypothetical protein
MKKLIVFVNDQSVYEYAKDRDLDETQIEFLDKMDSDMRRGIKVHGELIASPDLKQRASFVAMNLIKALQQENAAIIAASTAYLMNRLPGLVEVRAKDAENGVTIEFVEEH